MDFLAGTLSPDPLVLAAGSILKPKVYKAKFGTNKVPVGPRGILMHPLGLDGTRLDGKSESSDGSWCYQEDETLADAQKSKAEDENKVAWVPPTSVRGNDDYPSSVLHKDSYL